MAKHHENIDLDQSDQDTYVVRYSPVDNAFRRWVGSADLGGWEWVK